MPIEITMPRLSDTMEEGTLIKWHVSVGDTISSGDVLADVETDKATMELQSYDDGTVARLAVDEGQTLPVGALILVLTEEGESVEQAAAAAAAEAAAEAEQPSAAAATATMAPPTAPPGKAKASPLARKLAEEHGLDLGSIAGTGPGGRIVKRDILAAAGGAPPAVTTAAPAAPVAAAPATPPRLEARTVPVSNMRKTIARRLVESKTTAPHFAVTVAVNMDPLLDVRHQVNATLQSQGVKLSVNDFVVRATAMALLQHPMVNASWTDDGIQLHGTINVGVAVALSQEKGGGLVVPTLRDVHHMSLEQISAQTRQLATKAREQGLTLQEMSDGTFTISNLGMLGVEHFEAIINPPQAAILAVGAAIEKPVVRDGRIVVGREMTCTLSCDHRVVDGAMAAEFLATLKQLLENPAAMLV